MENLGVGFRISRSDVDPGQQSAINKFTQTTEVLWRKRDSMATL